MRLLATIVALVILGLLSLTRANAAGFKLIDIPADGDRPELIGAVWYPCTATPADVKFGPITFQAARDCPVAGTRLPLLVISHGAGGWFGGHHDTAEALADAGFIVAAINHPLDSGKSKIRRPDDIASMIERPEDITRLIDYMLKNWPDSSRINPERIGAFGFSRGGYTVLVAIGGNPDFRLLLPNCPAIQALYPSNHWCEQIRDGSALPQPFVHDGRIKAAVIADPALGAQFAPAGLKNVTIPIQLWASERGGDGVSLDDASTVDRNLSVKPDYRIVPNSGHFAFLAPCSAEFAEAARNRGEPEICMDAKDFDRLAFHQQFNAAMVQFFQNHLAALVNTP